MLVTRRLPGIVALYLLACFVTPAQSLAAERLSRSVQSHASAPGHRTAKVWVYFTDHGESSKEELRNLLDRVEINPRARARRAQRAGVSGADRHDLPVNAAYVDAVRSLGCKVRHESRYFNAVSAWASPEQLRFIARLPFVRTVDRVRTGTRALREPKPLAPKAERKAPDAPTNGARVRTTADDLDYGLSDFQHQQINTPPLHAEGYHGEGIRIAMLDTGFFLGHNAFSSLNVIAEWDFINNDSVTTDQPGDDSGQMWHGTMTLGTIASDWPGTVMGTAWAAEYILAKTERLLEEIQIEEDDFVAALEWADGLGVDVVSSSLGYYFWYDYEDMDGNTAVTTKAVDIAASRGILVVTSAGNEGSFPWPTLNAPADADSAITVGASDASGNVAYFSSRGPTYDGRIKPDVIALGIQVATVNWQAADAPAGFAGTSAATPLVAGACALILQKHPGWSPIQVRDALRATASHADGPNNDHGWGLIDAHAASNHMDAISVTLDIQPGSCNNPFNPMSRGVLPALLMGSPDLDVSNVDIASLRLAGAEAMRANVLDMSGEGGDDECLESSPDGFDDLLVKFNSADIAAAIAPVTRGDTVTLNLTGQLVDGTEITGNAVVRIVGGRGVDAALAAAATAMQEPVISTTFALYQNAPNPFNPTTSIRYDVATGGGNVTLRIFDVSGRLVRTLVDDVQSEGRKIVAWDGRSNGGRMVATGTYFYRLNAPGFEQTKKMVLLK